MARPRTKIDLAELEKLYGLQCTDREVAAFLGISVKTLERRRKIKKFAEAMDSAKAKGRVSVRRMLFSQGAKGNVAAAIFLAKNMLGYKDYFANEHSGPDGGPIVIGPAPELGELSDDEIKQLAILVGKTGHPRKG
ncbi:MAG: hypothetical protein ABSB35_21625 [Bryobacteraceae bacterium]|jgi:hypothetical protein